MSHDPVTHLLGLAHKAGRLEIGEEPVGAACRARQAKLVLLAADAAPNTCRRAAHFGEAGNVLFLTLPQSKAELGAALGRASCAMLALTDIGFAGALAKQLAKGDAEKYSAAAEALDAKAQKALQRQREQRQHEKNLRQGKRKPWAPPPAEQKPASQNVPTSRSEPGPGKRRLTGRIKQQ